MIHEPERGRLVAYAARLLGDPAEAEDVVQEALVRLPAADVACAAAWLRAVCYRLAVDRLRARRRERRALAGRAGGHAEAAGVLSVEEDHAAALDRREGAARLRAAVEALPEPYRGAVRLRYLEGLEFPEVARRLRTIERTARTWVGRGLAKLRERLGPECE